MLTQSINPIETTEAIKENYLHFLTSTFSLRNPELSERFKKRLEESTVLFKGPILQATPHYRSGKSLRDLMQEPNSGVSPLLLHYVPDNAPQAHQQALNLDRPVYSHQQQALRQIAEGNNLVVATGTGSGKTESFLYPILNQLVQERESAGGALTPGVRALLIYPMNALANDQMKRLRELIPPETGITFGRYTGQTRKTTEDAKLDFEQEHHQNPPQNEAISREMIREAPPHILVTNYAMLEYLLIRPQDSEIFQHDTWQFLVLDEAHTYKGALGTEIGYLMRKLQQRVAPQRTLQCIATSATIGDDKDPVVKQEIARAVSVLFGQAFSIDQLVFADKIPVAERLNKPSWGQGSEAFYNTLSTFFERAVHLPVSALADAIAVFFEQLLSEAKAEQIGYPPVDVLETAWLESDELEPENQLAQFLFLLLEGDERVKQLSEQVEAGPKDIQTLYTHIFESPALEIAEVLPLVQLIRLATFAKDHLQKIPLLMARYHFFVRSIEGLSVSFPEQDRVELHIGHHAQVNSSAGEISAFELKGCKRCGFSFLQGEIKDDHRLDASGARRFVSFPEKTKLTENNNRLTHLCIDLDEAIEPSEDASIFIESESHDDKGRREPKDLISSNLSPEMNLCLHCGCYGHRIEKCCEHPRIQKVREVHPSDQRTHFIKTCPACGGQKRDGIIMSFRNNENEGAFALGLSLFNHIPATCENTGVEQVVNDASLSETEDEEDFFADFSSPNEVSDAFSTLEGKKRLLAFSDSRRDAAFFAAYMQRQSEKLLHRQLMYQTLVELQHKYPDRSIGLVEWRDAIFDMAFEKLFFTARSDESLREVSQWLYAELCSIQSRKDLEGVGLVHWHLRAEVQETLRGLFEKKPAFLQKFELSIVEGLSLIEIFLHYLRQNSVVNLIEPMRSYQHDYFWPRERPYSIRLSEAEPSKSVSAWVTNSGRQNVRTAFLKKFAAHPISQLSAEKFDALLQNIWRLFIKVPVFENSTVLVQRELSQLWGYNSGDSGKAFQINPDIFSVALHPPDHSDIYGWYRCNDCRQIRGLSLAHLCPTYRCKGSLEAIDPEVEFKGHYYRRLYQLPQTELINVREHTAQISAKEGAEIQQQFIDDHQKLNMLSCSTTFELGVDVGQLHAVFLRNVPPGIANYVQRAGRAARRLDATAYILTFCRARSHDLSWFKDAESMVSGNVEPPRIPANNLEIARRHLHSIVFAQFFKAYPEFFWGPQAKGSGTLQWLFFSGENLAEALFLWLQEKPERLKQQLLATFDQETAQELGLQTWSWISNFLHYDEELTRKSQNVLTHWGGILGRAQAEMILEYDSYESIREEAKQADKDYQKRGATRQQERIKKTQILNYLPARGVLPKYGFPTDVVPLRVAGAHDGAKAIRLERDLRMAISEFAPGSALIANGKVYESYGLQTIPNKKWPEYAFHICKECGFFQRAVEKDDIKKCPSCMTPSGNTFSRFIIPSFGFTTSINAQEKKPVDVPPQRTYTSQVYFSSYDRQSEALRFVPEGDQKYAQQLGLQSSYRSDGKLVVLNTNGQNSFYICESCGFGATESTTKHETPWGKSCSTYLKRFALGHEFKSDVLELRFYGENLDLKLGQDVWWSTLFALVRGACKALEIEEDNLGGTLKQFAGGSERSLILYDTFPGGAGFVKSVASRLQDVIEAALRIVEECSNCSEEQSCQECLQNYQNQFVHSILKRGAAARLLRQYHSVLYHSEYDGYTPPLGTQNFKIWCEQKLRQVQKAKFIIPPLSQPSLSVFRENWILTLLQAARNGCEIHLFLDSSIENLRSFEHVDTMPLVHLFQQPNVYGWLYKKKAPTEIKAILHRGQESFLIKSSSTLFDLSSSQSPEFMIKTLLKQDWDHVADVQKIESWFNALTPINASTLSKQMQDTEYIGLSRSQITDWASILSHRLPQGLHTVEIYDRYLRRSRVYESLDNFLSMLNAHGKAQGSPIAITISTSFGSRLEMESRNPHSHEAKKAQEEKMYQEKHMFPDIRQNISERGRYPYLRLDEEALKTQHKDRTITHQRCVTFKAEHETLDLKLDKGFDILVSRGNNFYVAEDSYLVLVH